MTRSSFESFAREESWRKSRQLERAMNPPQLVNLRIQSSLGLALVRHNLIFCSPGSEILVQDAPLERFKNPPFFLMIHKPCNKAAGQHCSSFTTCTKKNKCEFLYQNAGKGKIREREDVKLDEENKRLLGTFEDGMMASGCRGREER